MATGYLSPIGLILQAFTDQGVVLSGGLVNTYVAGTTTPVTTYTDSTLTVPNANPIVLSATGRLPASVWASSGTVIKMVLQTSTGGTITGGTVDNLPGINDPNSLSLYTQSAQEISAGVTPTSTQYPVGDLRRYGAVMDGTTDDAAAWAKLALVMNQGVSGYCPPLPTMIKSNIVINAPYYKKIQLNGYGCTVYTTGAIYGLTIGSVGTVGGFMGGFQIQGFTHNNTTDSLCLGFINILGAQNIYVIDCWSYISGSAASSASYALVTMQPTTPGNDNTAAYWNKVIRCGTRQTTGNPLYYAPAAVSILGACNAPEITQCNFSSVNYAIQIANQVGGTGTVANAVYIHHNAFEGGLTGISINGNSVASTSCTGLRVTDNRAESLTNGFILFQNLTLDAACAPVLINNYLNQSVNGYITQSNNSVALTFNTSDYTTNPTFSTPVVVASTVTGGATSATLASSWTLPSGDYLLVFPDSANISTKFTNGSTAITFGSAVTNGFYPPVAITAVSGSGTSATFTFATQSVALQVGSYVTITGSSTAAYNGTFYVTASTTTTITAYGCTGTGTPSTLGTLSPQLVAATGATQTINTYGPVNSRNIWGGDARTDQAVTGYGYTLYNGNTPTFRVKNLPSAGAAIYSPFGNRLTRSSNSVASANNTGTGSISASTSVVVTMPYTEADTNYKIHIDPTSLPPGLWYVSATSTTTFTVTCAASGSWNFNWELYR